MVGTTCKPVLASAAAALALAGACTRERAAGAGADQAKRPAPVATAPAGSPPKIRFDSLIGDFGKVAEEAPLGYAFKFRNLGGTPLEILDVGSS